MCYLLEAIYNVYKNAAYILFDTAIQSLTRCFRKDFTQGCKDIWSTMNQMNVCLPKEDALPSTWRHMAGWPLGGSHWMKSRWRAPMMAWVSFWKQEEKPEQGPSLSLCHGRIWREAGPLQKIPERAFNRIAPAGTLILDFTASLTVINIFLLFRPPSLRCFIMATRAD